MIRFATRWLPLAALGALVLWTSRPVHAADLPKGDQVLDDYVKATGGKEAYEKVNNRVLTGTMEIAGLGVKGPLTLSQARPNKMLLVVDLAGVGKIEQGCDGKTVWERNPFTGARVKTGEEKASGLRDAMFDSDVNWRKAYKKAECVAEENVDGKPCYKLELTTEEGKKRTAYYDKQTHLLVKTVSTEKSPMGEVKVEATFGDYKKEGGILMPHKIDQKMAGQNIITTIEKVEQNAKLPDNRFDLPEEVKKLVEK